MNDELARLDATAQAELVRSGEAGPLELVDAAIERIEALNPELNAVIHPLFEQGREAARGDLPDGPFRGVPFLFKDLGAMLAGQPLHMGMELLKRIDFRAPVDTYLGQRFRAAGFVTVGKTNTPELGLLPTTEPLAYGPTRNPWDPDRTPGGSSGGSAAAVASGMVPVAHANDGGGSIRIPASHCGLVGLKTSRGRTSEGPLVGDVMSGLVTELVVSRSVRDTAAILDAVHGPAPGDPYLAPPRQRPYVEELRAEPGGLRIGLVSAPVIEAEVDPAAIAAVRDAAELLTSLGHEVSDVELPMAAGDLVERFLIRWAAGSAVTLELLAPIVGRAIGPDDVEPMTWALAEEGRRRSAADYLGVVGHHHALTRMVAGLHEAGLDLLLTPTVTEAPPPLGTYDDSGQDPLDAIHRASRTAAFTGLFNLTGRPAISLPLYWTDDGLPIGTQLAAPLGGEDVLIRVAAQLERAQPWAERIPGAFAAAGA